MNCKEVERLQYAGSANYFKVGLMAELSSNIEQDKCSCGEEGIG